MSDPQSAGRPPSTPKAAAEVVPDAVCDAGANDASNRVKRSEVLDCMRKGRLIVVTGTGVSLQSVGHPAEGTAVAGWPGLLEHGLAHCQKLKLVDEKAAKIVALQIAQGDTRYLIDAAQVIHDCLDKRTNGRFFWMKESVGQLKVRDPRLIKAIQGLGGLLATLNYDGLLHEVTQRPQLHWKQQVEIDSYLRGPSREFILHIHGMWDVTDSIILDRRSYDVISADGPMQELIRSFARWETMLFIGCGSTFFDPNFQTLLDWASTALKGARHRHFILCREEEEASIHSALQAHGYLEPLVYGRDYADLIPFLEALANEAGASAVAANPPFVAKAGAGTNATPNLQKPADLWKLQSHR